MAGPKLQKYARGTVFFNGAPLVECTEIEVTENTGAHDVETMAKGWAGESPGVQSCDITFGSVIPVSGREQNYRKILQNGDEVELVIGAAAETVVYKGFLRQLKTKFGVSAVSTDNIVMKAGQAEVTLL